MSIQMQPQEIYLLERYTSLAYFADLRDQWARMIKHVETCLDAYLQNLPPRYRSLSLSEQPDIVWGQRVLPNFRRTLHGLDNGFILLSHRDYKGLLSAWAPLGDQKGQWDFSTEWMSKADAMLYKQHLEDAVIYAGNIAFTESAGWEPFDLLDYRPERGPLNPPEMWPVYRVNKDVFVGSGKEVVRNGIYVPDIGNSCAQFLFDRYDVAPLATMWGGTRDLLDSITGEKWSEEQVLEKRPCTWFLVERISDEGELVVATSQRVMGTRRYIVGESCQVAGFYFTPAHSGSRRFFDKGAIFPAFAAAYGQTIWQWDVQQDASKS